MTDGPIATSHPEEQALGGVDFAPALRLQGIVKSWSSQPEPILAGVDLRVEAGSAVAISGRNGAGKTTLLRIAAGLILPEAGSVSLAGLDSEQDRVAFQRHVGFLSAGNSGLYGRLKAEHHLELIAGLALLPRRRRREAIHRVAKAFELAPLLGRRVDRLSMGQRQRLRLALVFLHEPLVVLMDEPTTSLDEDGIGLLQSSVDELRARGGAVVVCIPTGWEQLLSIDRSLRLADGLLESR